MSLCSSLDKITHDFVIRDFFGKTTSSCYITVDNHHSDLWLEVSGLRALKLQGGPKIEGAVHHQPPENACY